jgi:hypothetical protein
MASRPHQVAEFLDRDAAERFADALRRRGVGHVAVIPDGVRPDAWWALVRASDWPLAERIRDELQKG